MTDSLRDELHADNVTLAYEKRVIAQGLSVNIPAGVITSIIGPNGCGKSTLLRSLAGLLKPSQGQVTYGHTPLADFSRKAFARKVGLLPQTPIAPPGITVADLVGRGRHPHQGLFGRWSQADFDAVQAALEATHLVELADRCVDELSGGQRQRAWVAMALAQETETLLLDEPTTYLDVANQLEVLDVLVDLNKRQHSTIAMVLHDMNLAARYSQHIIAMKQGKIIAEGSPLDVVTEKVMGEVFGIDCRVDVDPTTATPVVYPYGRHHVRSHVR